MNFHVGRRLFLPAAVLGGVAVFTAVFFVALAVHSVVADPGGPVPNPGHQWTELQDHGLSGSDYWLGTVDSNALELHDPDIPPKIREKTSPKIRELENLIRDQVLDAGQKALVFSQWEGMIDIAKRLGLTVVIRRIKRPERKRKEQTK